MGVQRVPILQGDGDAACSQQGRYTTVEYDSPPTGSGKERSTEQGGSCILLGLDLRVMEHHFDATPLATSEWTPARFRGKGNEAPPETERWKFLADSSGGR